MKTDGSKKIPGLSRQIIWHDSHKLLCNDLSTFDRPVTPNHLARQAVAPKYLARQVFFQTSSGLSTFDRPDRQSRQSTWRDRTILSCQMIWRDKALFLFWGAWFEVFVRRWNRQHKVLQVHKHKSYKHTHISLTLINT
jgi:hypothetical protein